MQGGLLLALASAAHAWRCWQALLDLVTHGLTACACSNVLHLHGSFLPIFLHVEVACSRQGASAKSVPNHKLCRLLQAARHKRFRNIRDTIGSRLFAAKPAFAPALREVAASAAELAGVAFAAVASNHTYTLAEYGELQVRMGSKTGMQQAS
jgi:hypothetical protein